MQNSALKDKSEFNSESAKLLMDKGLYSPVAHCAYYSCYQLVKYIWLYKMNMTEQDLKTLCDQRNQNKTSKTNSHNILIGEVFKYMKGKSNGNQKYECSDFNTLINQLKYFRATSDYKDAPFNYSQSRSSIDLMDEIRPLLNKFM